MYPKPFKKLSTALLSTFLAAYLSYSLYDKGWWALIAGFVIVVAIFDWEDFMEEVDAFRAWKVDRNLRV